MPLNPDEYAVGRRVRHDATDGEFDIRDVLVAGSGNRYLVVTDPTHDNPALSLLIPEGQVRDEYEARDPEEVAQERESEQDARDNPVTDAPDVTDPQAGSPGAQGQDPSDPGSNPSPQTTPSQA